MNLRLSVEAALAVLLAWLLRRWCRPPASSRSVTRLTEDEALGIAQAAVDAERWAFAPLLVDAPSKVELPTSLMYRRCVMTKSGAYAIVLDVEKPMPNGPSDQATKFGDLARDLGCDEDEAAWDERLMQVAAHKPAPEPEEAQ